MSGIDEEVARLQKFAGTVVASKRERLRNMDFFCLDNSVRESTVGQFRSHTLKDKIDVYEQVKKCGIKDMIVATFSHLTRVDDDFVQYLKDIGEDFSHFYSFSELAEDVKDGTYSKTKPVGLRKNRKFGIPNTMFEVNLYDENYGWGDNFTMDDMCQLILKRAQWAWSKIDPNGRMLLNIRDLIFGMPTDPERVLSVVKFLSSLPDHEKFFGLMYEDAIGDALPEEMGMYAASLRRVMDTNGWKEGKILVHIHQKWDLHTAAVLDVLNSGADGVWASLCDEGAHIGHACSSVTMMNLVRMGNEKILKTYNCTQLRNAARAITKITTGRPPHPKQCVYGDRANDLLFGGPREGGTFNLAAFFNVKTPIRISTLVAESMIKDRLINLFSANDQFTEDMAKEMKKVILDDLRSGRKEEYTSKVGLALLFSRAGGKLTAEMSAVIADVEVRNPNHITLIADLRKVWDSFDTDKVNNDCLQFDSFYHGFMAPYFNSYRSPQTQKGLTAMDMDSDGLVDWNGFMVYVKWALQEYPETQDADDLLTIVFRKGLIPVVQDESPRTGVNNI